MQNLTFVKFKSYIEKVLREGQVKLQKVIISYICNYKLNTLNIVLPDKIFYSYEQFW